MQPIDLTTGQPCGASTHMVEVLVGYLVTHSDGFEARLAPDRTRAELYAIKSHATLEPMYVKRPAGASAP